MHFSALPTISQIQGLDRKLSAWAVVVSLLFWDFTSSSLGIYLLGTFLPISHQHLRSAEFLLLRPPLHILFIFYLDPLDKHLADPLQAGHEEAEQAGYEEMTDRRANLQPGLPRPAPPRRNAA